jgi:hypothetical protein
VGRAKNDDTGPGDVARPSPANGREGDDLGEQLVWWCSEREGKRGEGDGRGGGERGRGGAATATRALTATATAGGGRRGGVGGGMRRRPRVARGGRHEGGAKLGHSINFL